MNMKKIMLSRSIAFCLLTLICNMAFANSGIYKNLLIGIDTQTGVITGAYHDERSPTISPSFSCIFALKGNKKERIINVGFPGEKKLALGEIKFQEMLGKKVVFLKLDEQQPGCLQTTSFNFLQGDTLELTKSKPWISVMIVVAKKATFYNAPNTRKKRRDYVVYSDCVGILEIVNDWVKVEYVSENRSLIGWLRLKDLGNI